MPNDPYVREIDRALGDLFRELASESKAPTSREIEDYVAGRLSLKETQGFEERLALSAEAAAVALELRSVPCDAPAQEAEATARPLATSISERNLSTSSTAKPFLQRLPVAWGTAAASTLVAFSLALALFSSDVADERHSSSRVNVPVVDLLPPTTYRAASDDKLVGESTVISGRGPTLFLLTPRVVTGRARCQLEVLHDASGSVVFKTDELRPNEAGSFSVLLDLSSLPAGPYALRLLDDSGQELEVFHVDVDES